MISSFDGALGILGSLLLGQLFGYSARRWLFSGTAVAYYSFDWARVGILVLLAQLLPLLVRGPITHSGLSTPIIAYVWTYTWSLAFTATTMFGWIQYRGHPPYPKGVESFAASGLEITDEGRILFVEPANHLDDKTL